MHCAHRGSLEPGSGQGALGCQSWHFASSYSSSPQLSLRWCSLSWCLCWSHTSQHEQGQLQAFCSAVTCLLRPQKDCICQGWKGKGEQAAAPKRPRKGHKDSHTWTSGTNAELTHGPSHPSRGSLTSTVLRLCAIWQLCQRQLRPEEWKHRSLLPAAAVSLPSGSRLATSSTQLSWSSRLSHVQQHRQCFPDLHYGVHFHVIPHHKFAATAIHSQSAGSWALAAPREQHLGRERHSTARLQQVELVVQLAKGPQHTLQEPKQLLQVPYQISFTGCRTACRSDLLQP